MTFVNFEFSGARSTFSRPAESWQVLLWIEADFRVVVADGVLLSTSHWCIFEFGQAMCSWLKQDFENQRPFIYTSMDEEDEGLLSLSPMADGKWRISSVWQEFQSEVPVPSEVVREACLDLVERVRTDVLRLVDPVMHAYVVASCT